MGSLCSKASSYEGGHTVLGSSADGPRPDRPEDPRAAMLQAAEARLQANRSRGAPRQGALSEQAAKPLRKEPEPRQEERLVWD